MFGDFLESLVRCLGSVTSIGCTYGVVSDQDLEVLDWQKLVRFEQRRLRCRVGHQVLQRHLTYLGVSMGDETHELCPLDSRISCELKGHTSSSSVGISLEPSTSVKQGY